MCLSGRRVNCTTQPCPSAGGEVPLNPSPPPTPSLERGGPDPYTDYLCQPPSLPLGAGVPSLHVGRALGLEGQGGLSCCLHLDSHPWCPEGTPERVGRICRRDSFVGRLVAMAQSLRGAGCVLAATIVSSSDPCGLLSPSAHVRPM